MDLIRYLRAVAVLGFFVFTSFVVGQEDKPASSELILTQEGKLPIILSAPHGGKLAVPGVPERTGTMAVTKSSGTFVTVRDTGTEELTKYIAEAIEKKTGKKPYMVVARFNRKFIDANRSAEIGYENPNAKPHYDAYHQSLDLFCRAVKKEFGRGLLLDIHGQAAATDTIFRGTQNGKTVELLTNRFGSRATSGPESFCGLLAATGIKVSPTDSAKEHPSFNGGHIVQTYGSQSGYAIDAIQLEFGSDFRVGEKRLRETAQRVAGTVETFIAIYLKTEPAGP